MDVFQSDYRMGSDGRKLLAEQIEEQEMMLSKARKCYMADEIDGEFFKALKKQCTEALVLLERKLAETPNKAISLRTVEGLLDIVVFKYSNIQLHYKSANIVEKRKMIGSMFPKNRVLTE